MQPIHDTSCSIGIYICFSRESSVVKDIEYLVVVYISLWRIGASEHLLIIFLFAKSRLEWAIKVGKTTMCRFLVAILRSHLCTQTRGRCDKMSEEVSWVEMSFSRFSFFSLCFSLSLILFLILDFSKQEKKTCMDEANAQKWTNSAQTQASRSMIQS